MGNPDTSVPRLALTVEETAAALGLCTKTVYKLVNLGHLKTTRIGLKWLITPKSLDEMLRRRYVSTDDGKRKRRRPSASMSLK